MTRKIILFLVLSVFLACNIFGIDNSTTKFIKGNIQEKIEAVKEAPVEEAPFLSKEAMNFVLKNKKLLGYDKDLETLAVTSVVCVPVEYCKNASENEKQQLLQTFMDLFQIYNNNSTVQVAVLSKILFLKDIFPTAAFTDLLNDYIKRSDVSYVEPQVIKAVIHTLGIIGNNTSFIVMYNLWNNDKYVDFYPEITNTIQNLAPLSMNEILQIIKSQKLVKVQQLFDLLKTNTKLSPNNLSEIAENVLNVAILRVGDVSQRTDMLSALQMESLRILSQNNWTRASGSATKMFTIAKQEYAEYSMSEENFIEIITAMSNVAPIESINPLTFYLWELNGKCEKKQEYSEAVVIAVVNTLGLIGDKAAFDCLLAITYLNYPETILSAARDALAGLKW